MATPEEFEKRKRLTQKQKEQLKQKEREKKDLEILQSRKDFGKLCAKYHGTFKTYGIEEWPKARDLYAEFKKVNRDHLLAVKVKPSKTAKLKQLPNIAPVLDHRMSYCALMFFLGKTEKTKNKAIYQFIKKYQAGYINKGVISSNPQGVYAQVQKSAEWKALTDLNIRTVLKYLRQAGSVLSRIPTGNWGKGIAAYLSTHGDKNFDDPQAAQRLRKGVLAMEVNGKYLLKRKIAEKSKANRRKVVGSS